MAAMPPCAAQLLSALEEAQRDALAAESAIRAARADCASSCRRAETAEAIAASLRSERDALLKVVDAFTGTMQAHVEGVAAVAQLKAANQRAEAASQSLASAQEETATTRAAAAAMQATLDATMNQHASELAALKAVHAEQVQRFEIDANKQAAVAEELRQTVAALQAGAPACAFSCLLFRSSYDLTHSWSELARRDSAPAQGSRTPATSLGGAGAMDAVVQSLKTKLMAAKQEADGLRKELNRMRGH